MKEKLEILSRGEKIGEGVYTGNAEKDKDKYGVLLRGEWGRGRGVENPSEFAQNKLKKSFQNCSAVNPILRIISAGSHLKPNRFVIK